jgi:hypothetical protein
MPCGIYKIGRANLEEERRIMTWELTIFYWAGWFVCTGVIFAIGAIGFAVGLFIFKYVKEALLNIATDSKDDLKRFQLERYLKHTEEALLNGETYQATNGKTYKFIEVDTIPYHTKK